MRIARIAVAMLAAAATPVLAQGIVAESLAPPPGVSSAPLKAPSLTAPRVDLPVSRAPAIMSPPVGQLSTKTPMAGASSPFVPPVVPKIAAPPAEIAAMPSPTATQALAAPTTGIRTQSLLGRSAPGQVDMSLSSPQPGAARPQLAATGPIPGGAHPIPYVPPAPASRSIPAPRESAISKNEPDAKRVSHASAQTTRPGVKVVAGGAARKQLHAKTRPIAPRPAKTG